MTRVGIDPKYKGGSIRMAAASAAIDRGVPIEVVLDGPVGRSSTVSTTELVSEMWPRAFEHWLNFASLSSPFNTHMIDMC